MRTVRGRTMKAMAGAVVTPAGAITFTGAVVTHGIVTTASRPGNTGNADLAMLAGAAGAVIGLWLVYLGWVDDRRPGAGPTPPTA